MPTTSGPPPPRRHVRVAIVGSGLTGLVATYLLTAAQPHSEDAPRISVDIFERAPTLGMDSASITVPLPAPSPPPKQHTPPRLTKRAKRQTPSPAKGRDASDSMRIDVPMRAFTGGYYPQLLALYRHLGIRARKTNFTYSFASLASLANIAGDKQQDARAAPTPSLLYNGANGVRGISLPAHLMQLRDEGPLRVSAVLACVVRLRDYFGSLIVLVLGYVQLLLIALWHSGLGHTVDVHHPLRTRTLRDLVVDPFPPRAASTLRCRAERLVEMVLRRVVRLDERFVEQTLAPLFSAVMTCSLDAVWASPASEVLDYVALTLGRDHFVVQDGVRTVVQALLVHVSPADQEASRVWTRAQVCDVRHRDGRAWLSVLHHAVEGGAPMSREASSSSVSAGTDSTCVDDVREHGPFDHIIFATQADQTARFLEQYTHTLVDGAERHRVQEVVEALSTFRYERSVVVNHTDRTLLPERISDWRDLNLVSPAASLRLDRALARRTSSASDWTDASSDSSDTEVEASAHTMATHILRVSAGAPVVMQTTNPHSSLEPHEDTVLSRARFQRAVLDVDAHVARQKLFTRTPTRTPTRTLSPNAIHTAGGTQLQLGPLQRVRAASHHAHVWVAGSWASGIPLLEGCVVSATLVAQSIVRAEGAAIPSSATW